MYQTFGMVLLYPEETTGCVAEKLNLDALLILCRIGVGKK